MPQLDTLHILLTLMWTWTIMMLILQKMGPSTLRSKPKNPSPHKTPLKYPPLPWL